MSISITGLEVIIKESRDKKVIIEETKEEKTNDQKKTETKEVKEVKEVSENDFDPDDIAAKYNKNLESNNNIVSVDENLFE